MRTKPGVDSLSFDDLYNNLRVFESNVKASICIYNLARRMWHLFSEKTLASKGNQDSRRRDAWNTGNKDKENGRSSGKQEDSKALVTLNGEAVQAQTQRYALREALQFSSHDREISSLMDLIMK
ncbi:hypothetical protein Tco_0658052 [Tanacetum coccineum]